ncbi:gamma subclass chorismate mutase AroQ [Pseudonocardia sp.]|uniref:gamma subclass chorismate mutase AroQ n=1 Tax=Pseudonocardia sp. TaxID=60912 RepID=UPI002D8064B6|nr:gamma subclass chorismate mutase AroQ [Pseudonocardia sp.]
MNRGSKRQRVALLVLGATLLLLGACAGQSSAPAPAPSQQPGGAAANPLSDLVALAAQRIGTGDVVSAAKFGTPQAIDDPAREKQELDAVAAESPGLGVNPAESAQFFRDQIEASKVVQRGLYQLWTAHPELRPTTKPDLSKTVRPELDALTTEIMHQLQVTAAARHSGAQCATQSAAAVADAAKPLDQLHRGALDVATHAVCAPA